ncbi:MULTISPECIES: hypothetical protein [Bradyrhizobium]|uniref:hypothetical protein n=1 Tax=Bradyrhizobium TaxID=374 RepID=UPI0012FE3D95|nr:hypothetical protein [Bradyrhizobium elkanii]WLA82200.1 hypothetical protein QNJ99_43865 [Bradyrhizobium elkanii]
MTTSSIYVGFRLDSKLKRAGGFYFSEKRQAVEEWIANGGKRPGKKTNEKKRREQLAETVAAEEESPTEPSSKLDSFEALTERFLHSMNQFEQLIPTTLRTVDSYALRACSSDA